VVGGGVAGMAAAARAAERGHAVTLFEAASTLGGQFRIAQAIPGKKIFGSTIAYYAEQMRRHGVTVKLNSAADADGLVAGGFEAVVLAAGISPRALDIEGAGHASVVGYTDLLSGTVEPGRRVVIIGAGGIGFDVAIYLLERHGDAHRTHASFARHWGIDTSITQPGGLTGDAHDAAPAHEITMLKRSEGRFGRTLGLTTGWVHQINLRRAGVSMIDAVTYRRIDDAGVHISQGDEDRILPADTVVVCAGQVARDGLMGELEAQGIAAHLIGGARLAAELDAMRAIEEGTRIADQL
jgi:2,4-dienoyl-CoA reductase (NADPH2)